MRTTATYRWRSGKWRAAGYPDVAPATSGMARPTPGTLDPTTGVPYVTYESLYVAGDSVQGALDRAAAPCVVTFPEGRFLLQGFARFNGALNCTNNRIMGLWGSGRGDLAGASGTIFEVAAGSSTLVQGVDPQVPATSGSTQVMIIRANGNAAGFVAKNVQIRGTEQGHRYHGLYIYQPAGPVLIEDVLVVGWSSGDLGYPPYETFGVEVNMGSAHPAVLRRVEVDGRRSPTDATQYGGAGLWFGKTVGGLMEDCTAHHCKLGNVVAWHTYNTDFVRVQAGSLATDAWGASDGNFSFECCSGIRLKDCRSYRPSLQVKPHVNFSNANHTDTLGGQSLSSVNGSLEIWGGSYTNNLSDGRWCVESWTSGTDGTAIDTMTTPPRFYLSNGTTGSTGRWVHSTHQIITTPSR